MDRKEKQTWMYQCSINMCFFVLFQEVLELAFSILYDSSGQLNFIAPDKHEVSHGQSTEISFKLSLLL